MFVGRQHENSILEWFSDTTKHKVDRTTFLTNQRNGENYVLIK